MNFKYFTKQKSFKIPQAVDKTKPIAIGKEVYAMKHDFS